MSDVPNGNGSNGNGMNGQWKAVLVPVATLLLGGSVGANVPRSDDVKVAVMEVKLEAVLKAQEKTDLQVEKVNGKLDAVIAALPLAKERR